MRTQGGRACFWSVLTHLYTFHVDPGAASSGVTEIRSQHGVGTINCLRAASDVIAPKLTLRFDIVGVCRSTVSRL